MGSALAPVLCSFNNRTPVVAKFSQHPVQPRFGHSCTVCRHFFFMKDSVEIHGHNYCFSGVLGPPILLEYVHEEKFLGTTCSVVQGTITTIQPTDSTVLTCSFRFSSKDSDDHQAHQTNALIRPQGGGLN